MLGYFIKSAFGNLWESKVTSIFTAVTLSVALGFLGAYIAVFINMKAALGTVNERFPLTVYMADGAGRAKLDAVQKALETDPSVAGFDYTSKEKALRDFKGTARNEGQLIEGLGGNPLPASFDVRLKADSKPPAVEALVKGLRSMSGVEEVQYMREEAGKLKKMLESFKFGGMVLGLGVLLGVAFISYSTLRLAVLRHRDEIEVMKLMGSTRLFIMGPFLLEGLFQGLAAASLSIGLLYGLLRALSGGSFPLFPAGISFLPAAACAGIMVAGGLLGLTGSFFAFFRTLRF